MSGWRWAIVVSFVLAVATGVWKGGFWPGVAMWASLLLWIAIVYGICEAVRASDDAGNEEGRSTGGEPPEGR